MAERIVNLDSLKDKFAFFGEYDSNIKLIESECDVKINFREDTIKVYGDTENIDMVNDIIEVVVELINNDQKIDEQFLRYIISLSLKNDIHKIYDITDKNSCISIRNKMVFPKTLSQRIYVNAIKNKSIVLGIGPAGTGKTYLAVVMAVMYFNSGVVDRIILTRPAVEAGEKLGFLPGDLQDKVDPYLKPLQDALIDVLGSDKVQKLQERGIIEVAPLAYMRGRTLNNSFIILDEAQNTTASQMKMFLTRLGFNSKIVITGDITQIDIPDRTNSGLINAMKVLKDIDDISIMEFTKKDVVRHRLVMDIIEAYDKFYDEVGMN